MLKQTVKYKNFDGVEQTRDLYFHISRGQVVLGNEDVYKEIMKVGENLASQAPSVEEASKLMDKDNPFDPNTIIVSNAFMTMFKLIDQVIDMSYGIRGEDGEGFLKSPEILAKFKTSFAYEAFIDKLLADPEEMINFIKALTPSKD